MSKRNKKFRSNRSAFKLEALEQRQLLATIVGTGGTEVGSDITVSGKVYDQILMTGSTVTVGADAGQITRVDFMDAEGDIVRAEFSGAGTLNISLSSFVAAATPTKYAISGTQYVSGLATFTISNSDATSSFLVTSLGPLGPAAAFQGLLNPIFANGTLTGGNNVANISRLVIVGDADNLVNGAGTSFGTVNAANAIFSDTSGVTGIYAPNTSFKTGSTITVGDVIAAGSATGVLQVGLFSDVKTINVAGGKLAPASGATNSDIADLNITKVISQTGTNSNGVTLATQTIDAAANFTSGLANSNVTYTSGAGTVTIDGSTATTASLDALYKSQYLQDVIINNGLAAGVVFHALQFGNITVNGNLAGIITTDADNGNDSDNSEQAIGNVTINGDILDGGYIESATSIGNVTVTGKVTHTTTAPTVTIGGVPTANAPGVITTIGRGSFNSAVGNVSFGGDVSVTAAESLITANRTAASNTGGIGTITGTNLTANTGAGTLSVIGSSGGTGSIGALTFTGDVSLTSTGGGGITSGRAVGAITAKSLTLNVLGTAGITTTQTSGSIGAITTTGGNLTLTSGDIKSTAAIGNIWVSNTGNLVINDAIAAATNIGNITVDAGSMTSGAAGTIATTAGNIGNITLKAGVLTVGGTITAAAGNIGDITLTNSPTVSAINAAVGATVVTGVGGTIGNVLVTAGDLTVAAAITGGLKIGNVTVTAGDLTVTGSLSAVNGAAWEGTSIGNVTVSAGKIVGGAANIEFQANKIGNVSVTGKAATVNLLADVIFSAKGVNLAGASTSSIGNITLDNSLNTAGTGVISASAVSTAANTGTGFSSTGSVGNVSITTFTNGKVINDATASLIIRAGNSEMGADVNTLAGGAAVKDGTANTVNSVSIGNVVVSSNLSSGGISVGNAVGNGLMILSGVDLIAAGSAATAAKDGVTFGGVVTGTALTAGSIGTVTLNDLAGAVTRSSFSSAVLNENNTLASAGGSVIMGDTIGVVKVNTGIELLNITPTGLSLKGAIGGGLATTTNLFAGNDANKLFVVVL